MNEEIEWILISMNCVKAYVENVENNIEYCCACKVRVCNNIIKKKIKIRIETMNICEKSKNIELIKEKKYLTDFIIRSRFYFYSKFFFFHFFLFFFFIVENWYWHTYGFIYIESFLLNFKIKIVDWFFYFKVVEMGSFWYVSILSTSQLQCIGFSRRL